MLKYSSLVLQFSCSIIVGKSFSREVKMHILKNNFHFILIILSAVLVSLSGCLLTMGAPLARKVEPGKWTIEGGAGVITGPKIASSGSTVGIAAYLYASRALGRHFEIGVLPYYYGYVPLNVGAVYVPVKWDPFNYDFPFHLTLNAGPLLFVGTTSGPTIAAGLGLSYYFLDSFELYASLSSTTAMVQAFTSSLGTRYAINKRLQVGAFLMFNFPDLAAAEITIGTKLGK